jgi:putative flippase GtrA
MQQRASAQFVRYLLVGGTSALAYILIAMALTRLGLSAGTASVGSYLLVIPPAYLGQRILTFRASQWHGVAFPKYLTLQVAGTIAGYFLSNRLAELGWPGWAVFAAVAVMVASTNFLVLKYWAFRAHA